MKREAGAGEWELSPGSPGSPGSHRQSRQLWQRQGAVAVVFQVLGAEQISALRPYADSCSVCLTSSCFVVLVLAHILENG